jgi:glycosyltransferase 2 family protein
MDFATLGRAFAAASLWPLVLAAALNFVCLSIKAVCWRLMLAPRHRVSVLRLFRVTIATFAASAIAPARAGEVLRVWTLKRREGVPVADTAAVAVAEKLLDGLAIVILVAPIPWLLPGLPSWVATAIGVCAAIGVVVFVGLVIAIGRVKPKPGNGGEAEEPAPGTLVRRFLAGMHVLRSPRRLLGTMALLLVMWTLDLGQVMAVLYAVGVDLPIAGGILVLFTLNLTIAVPSTPAQVGALEVGALVGLGLLGVPREAGLAFALLYHATQVIPLVAAGLVLELRLVLGRDVEAPAPDGPAAGSGAERSVARLPTETPVPAPATRGHD